MKLLKSLLLCFLFFGLGNFKAQNLLLNDSDRRINFYQQQKYKLKANYLNKRKSLNLSYELKQNLKKLSINYFAKINNELKIENEELIVEEMLKNQPIKVKENQENESTSESNDVKIDKATDRLEVLKKIEELEREGKFDIDAENDPPTIVLTPENIDYLRTTMTSKIKRIFANRTMVE